MKIRTSYVRILIGDNDPNAPVYSDADIAAAFSIGPTVPAYPEALRLAAILAFEKYPGATD